jgi:hypothetical protein
MNLGWCLKSASIIITKLPVANWTVDKKAVSVLVENSFIVLLPPRYCPDLNRQQR